MFEDIDLMDLATDPDCYQGWDDTKRCVACRAPMDWLVHPMGPAADECRAPRAYGPFGAHTRRRVGIAHVANGLRANGTGAAITTSRSRIGTATL